jgi:outer membrane lipoprotein SlyB
MIVRTAWTLALIALIAESGLSQTHGQKGATLGGVTGAVIGGIIGHQNDETPEGVLIGGAVGAIAGGLLGHAEDKQLAQQRAYQEQVYYQQQQQAYAQQQAIAYTGVSMADVINMSRSGVSESVIMSQLHGKGVQRRLEVSDIISLHQQGVSDTVITAMQQAPLATQLAAAAQPAQPVYAQPTNVIVREQPVIYRSPVIVHEYYRPVPVHRHYYRGSHSSTTFRLGF